MIKSLKISIFFYISSSLLVLVYNKEEIESDIYLAAEPCICMNKDNDNQPISCALIEREIDGNLYIMRDEKNELKNVGRGGTAKVVRAYHVLNSNCVVIKQYFAPFTPKNENQSRPLKKLNEENNEVDAHILAMFASSEWTNNERQSEMAAIKKWKELFRNEVNLLKWFKAIDAKHIIRLIASEEKENSLSIIMEAGDCNLQEYIKEISYSMGTNLIGKGWNGLKATKLQQRNYITQYLVRISQLTAELIEAIIELHEHAIHIDIKPANIVMVNDRPKLIDFGFSVLRKKTENELETNFSGTYQFASPELLLSEKIDVKVDIWSFGVVVYQMLFGFNKYPFPMMNEEFWQKIFFMNEWDGEMMLGEEEKMLEKKYKQVNLNEYERLIQLVKLCIRKEPEQRPTAIELREAFAYKSLVLRNTLRQQNANIYGSVRKMLSISNNKAKRRRLTAH